jgi:biopolymer transport protein ExbB
MEYFLNPILAGGGEIMVLILMCSFVIWWLFIDSIIKINAEKKALHALQNNLWQENKKLTSSLFYPYIQECLNNKNKGIPLPSFTKALDVILPKLERRLQVAGTIVQIAPLLGLLGTVSGMIMTFDSLRHQNIAGAPFAEGIAKALYTTEFGLLVAIPGVYFGFLLGRMVDRLQEGFRLWLFQDRTTLVKGIN